MNILITGTSLDPEMNVSGISSVVSSIIKHSQNNIIHYQLGREDTGVSGLNRFAKLLAQLIRFPFAIYKYKIDIVHDNLPFNAKGVLRESVILLWCKLLRLPVLVHVHGGRFLMQKCGNRILLFLIRFIFKSADQIIVLSEIEQETILKLYGIKASVIYNAVDTTYFVPDEKKLLGRTKTVLFIGRLHESKGLNDIVDAFRLLYPKVRFRFILCGEGKLKHYLVNSLTEIMGSDFVFHGVVAGEKKKSIFHESEIFILPSRYGEGLPIALLEAMASGLIPVVTDDGSMTTIIKNNENAFLVSKNDPHNIAQRMHEALCLTETELRRFSRSARSSVVQRFDIVRFIANIESVYSSMAKAI